MQIKPDKQEEQEIIEASTIRWAWMDEFYSDMLGMHYKYNNIEKVCKKILLYPILNASINHTK